tara:strand:- start:4826 stop:5299 length:474 start_codon:yes stop_codon:yes gene_type:complete
MNEINNQISEQANTSIDNFLNKWVDAYFEQIVKTYKNISEKKPLTRETSEFKWMDSEHGWIAKKLFFKQFDINWFKSFDEFIEHTKKRLIGEKKENLIYRVNKKGGSISKVHNIELVGGQLEGNFQTQSGNVHLRTIYAGGYHIQTLHLRMICTLSK